MRKSLQVKLAAVHIIFMFALKTEAMMQGAPRGQGADDPEGVADGGRGWGGGTDDDATGDSFHLCGVAHHGRGDYSVAIDGGIRMSPPQPIWMSTTS
jgi:hypothetical protein